MNSALATSLHQQLKEHYVSNSELHEVTVGGYRIDCIDSGDRLIEIQCASLSAIRRKVQDLLKSHRVIVVKPLASRKLIVRMDRRDGEIVSSRYSPLRQSLMHVFQDLVHFAGVFPNRRLRLDVLLTDQTEVRIPPTDRSSWRKKHSVQDRCLVTVSQHFQFTTPAQLWDALELVVPERFTTHELADISGYPRWLCQKAAWCFRNMGIFDVCDKQGNSMVYRIVRRKRRRPVEAA